MENAKLRDSLIAAAKAHEVARHYYLNVVEHYCGHRRPGGYMIANPEGNSALVAAKQLVDQAYEYRSCWYDNANTSLYPGHIPHTC